MTWFNLCRIVPPGDPHAAALDEVADTLRHGIEALGYPVEVLCNTFGSHGINLVLGAHLLDAPRAGLLSPDTIVYNVEQIDEDSDWLRGGLLVALERCVVWDYSENNLERIRELTGNTRLAYVPVGYVPQLTRIAPAESQDIDVLFYGSMNDRRQRIVDALRVAGLEVCVVFGVYGSARDRLIARAKVVINMHYYNASVFEMVRVTYLLANRKAVVAECRDEKEVYPDLRDAIRLASYDGLVGACRELVGETALRTHYEDMGFRRMSALRAADLLRPAVTAAVATQANHDAR